MGGGGLALPCPGPGCVRRARRAWQAANELGADCAKKTESRSMRSRTSLRRARESHPCISNTMTLGNGYLGSRIDEERSEMRYLV